MVNAVKLTAKISTKKFVKEISFIVLGKYCSLREIDSIN